MPGSHISHQTGLDADIWFWSPPEAKARSLTLDERESLSARSMVLAEGASYRMDPAEWSLRKQELLEQAQFVVLPSLSEGLPVTVLEAWAAGTPTILSRESNLPEGFEAGAAIESGLSAEPIAAALERALGLNDPQWLAMSAAAQRLAAGRFSAATVAQTWADAYRALIDNSPQPGTGLASAHNSTQFQGSSAP